jgi:hypothetical protein
VDQKRFDSLVKSLAERRSRRGTLAAGVMAVIGAVGIGRGVDAATCRAGNEICRKDGDCCGGVCGAADRTGRRRCGCPEGTHSCGGRCVGPNDSTACGASCTHCPGDACNVATCNGGECGTTTQQNGTPCGTSASCCQGVCCDELRHNCVIQLGGCVVSCFVAGTRVAMADGTSKPIELVSFGDLVLGQDGAVSRVIGLDRPVLGPRLLFGFNGGEAFVTAEHPFMTAAGWKSIDPQATADEGVTLPVARLVAGDSLIELAEALVPAMIGGNEPVEIRTATRRLASISERSADPATPLYNLILDGDHTYFANELLVHNKG